MRFASLAPSELAAFALAAAPWFAILGLGVASVSSLWRLARAAERIARALERDGARG